VRNLILHLFAKLCKALIIAFWDENRVISEAFCTMFLGCNTPFDTPFKLMFYTIDD